MTKTNTATWEKFNMNAEDTREMAEALAKVNEVKSRIVSKLENALRLDPAYTVQVSFRYGVTAPAFAIVDRKPAKKGMRVDAVSI